MEAEPVRSLLGNGDVSGPTCPLITLHAAPTIYFLCPGGPLCRMLRQSPSKQPLSRLLRDVAPYWAIAHMLTWLLLYISAHPQV